MAHIEKFKKVQVKELLEHNSRIDDTHTHSNEEIDSTKSYLNYDLCRNQSTAYERFKKRLSEVKCLSRDDVNVIDSLVVHLPEDVKKGDERKFFEGVYAFACKDFGEKNIVNANVHRDETREHIHLGFIPVVEKLNKKKGIMEERVCHDEKITRSYYKNLHTNLMKYMKAHLGYEVSILNGATANGNKTIQELKAETLKKENEKTKKELDSLKKQVQKFRKEQQANIGNLINNIPKLELEELPVKPEPPQKPEWKGSYIDRKEEREDKKAWKNYDKEVAIYERKILPEWKKECDVINQRNDVKRAEWDSKYKTTDNLRKAQGQIERTLSRATYIEEQANKNYEKVEKERRALEEEKKQLEMQKQQQEFNQQRIIQELVQRQVEEEIREIKDRQDRLEQFCDTIILNDGSTVLQQFLEIEEELEELEKGFFE